MDVELITPTPRSRKGNWVTAERWARILRGLGHRVTIRQGYSGADRDFLLALHARKSFAAIERFHRERPERALVLTLTGTDLYRDLRHDTDAHRALDWADRLILLQGAGYDELAPERREKTRVILQSAVPTRARVETAKRHFQICVVGHLRPVKDPFRAAEAVRHLPASSRARVVHAGGALSGEMAEQARAEMEKNPRYRWLGDLPRWRVNQLLARSHVMVLSSEMEGGANVVSEAIVAGLPVVSTRIPGSIGMLGDDHPGYFAVGDTEGLAALLERCENEPVFLEELAERSRRLAPLFDPAREIEAWRELLDELRTINEERRS